MPFLRYETEDTVSLNLDSSGYSEKVAFINGRSDDILTAKDGSMIPGVNFYSWVSKSLKEIKMFQIVQKNKIDVVFYYISDGEKSSEIENKIWMGLSARLGDLNFVIKKVSEITRNPRSGKIRAIVNEN
jgi:phenylacetate-coenzyme A ligase PaaK-like adenylate-forming protein